MQEVQDFLNELGIELEAKETEDGYEVSIPDSNEYNKIFTILDRSEEVEEDPDLNSITLDTFVNSYFNDDYDILLSADFEQDVYNIKITKR